MKQKIFFFILLPFFGLSQVQIGSDINGDAIEDEFGVSVSLSNDGNIIAIGASRNDDNGLNSGHAKVYENINDVWMQIGQVIIGEEMTDESGFSVSLSGDGSIVAVGAFLNSDNGSDSGHVRIYENINEVWTQVGQDIDGESVGDHSGTSVSLSSDGTVVAIGAPRNLGTDTNSGHVRIYENINNVWTQIGQDIDGEAGSNLFGESVSLSSNGDIVAIGARFNNGNGLFSGHIRVYENQSGSWVQIGSDIDGESAEDFSGFSISLSSDGSIVAIGAYLNDGNGIDSGHVRVFENQLGSWVQIGSDIDGEAAGDFSGTAVSLSSNGTIVAISAINNDGNGTDSGHVRIYENLNGDWFQIGSDIDGEMIEDFSGTSISLSNNGSVLAIGARNNDGNGIDSGHVRVFDLSALLSTEDYFISRFSMFPNPAKNQFTIQLNDASILEKVTVYNSLGQDVLASNELLLDTSKLTSGAYIVEITTNTGKASKTLIIE